MEINRESILSTLKKAGSQGLKTKDIADSLRAGSRELESLRSLLTELESEGRIICGRRRRYQLPDEAGYLKGTLFGYGKNVGVLVPSDGSPRLRVASDSLNGAHHGDGVLARTIRGRTGDREAQVVKILERAPSDVIGQISARRQGRLVNVDQSHRHKSVAVEGHSSVKPGDYVLVSVKKWGEPHECTRGRITEVFGGRFTPGEAFASIVKEFNLPLGFPKEVVREVDRIPDTIPETEIKRRTDFTELLTFTIDPEDAKDFDDAISVEDLGKGRLRVGVHIADVSHYVRQGSHLDHEAMARGRSVYLVDRVIPMLPAKLSGELASLKPDVPRLTVSVMMDVSRRGDVSSYVIKESVIRSRARLTYAEAQKLIDKGAGWRARKQAKQITESLRKADELRKILKGRRVKRGAMELETPEVNIVLDKHGSAVDVKPAVHLDSHNLIEELMILANETIAKHMSYLGRLFMYRIHEVPDEKDMKDLAVFSATLGYRFRWTKGTSPKALQALLNKATGRPEEYIISMFILRSLRKAIYSERNVGHFGLASQCYTHFTSPIRRYPDLVVHRLLKIFGLHGSSPRDKTRLLKFIRQAAEISSMREMEGDNAERASIKARMAEFMEQKVGEEHWGIISGVKDFGLFVMLEKNLVEGLVHVSTLQNDYYTPDSTGTMLIGSRTGRYYRIGDKVLVSVARVDRERREVDFVIISRDESDERRAGDVGPEGRAGKRRLYGAIQEAARRAQSPGRRRGSPGRRRPQKTKKVTSSLRRKRTRPLGR
ncbi:MAG: ribonuclease R [Candidatus Eisenbacteria bacterium]